MGASIGPTDKKCVDVELNIVPFIDLMSCLTAFLLVAAVWGKLAQPDIHPKGKSRDPSQINQEEEKVVLSVLIQKDRIWIGQSRINEFQPIERTGEDYWGQVRASLEEIKKSAFFIDRGDIEIAAESLGEDNVVIYQDIIRVMDISKGVGFEDIGLTDRDGLTAKPTL